MFLTIGNTVARFRIPPNSKCVLQRRYIVLKKFGGETLFCDLRVLRRHLTKRGIGDLSVPFKNNFNIVQNIGVLVYHSNTSDNNMVHAQRRRRSVGYCYGVIGTT